MLVELHVDGARDLGLARGGDQLGVEVLGQVAQRLHDALHVHDHGLDRAGDDRQLLVQEVAGRWDAVAHQDLVRRAADAGQVDALGALGLGVGDQLGILGSDHDHLRQGRLVAVDDDVDLVVLQHAQVGHRLQRGGRAEQDVGDVGGQHRAAPAVGQRSAHGVVQDVLRVQVDALVGAVQRLDHLAVDAAGHDAQLAPDLLALLGGAPGVDDLAALLAKLLQRLVAHVQGDLFLGAAGGGDAHVAGDGVQLGLVADR